MQKILIFLVLLFSCYLTFAAYVTGIPELDDHVLQWQDIIILAIKFVGIGLIAIGVALIVLGKLKGEVLSHGASLVCGLGLICATCKWWLMLF